MNLSVSLSQLRTFGVSVSAVVLLSTPSDLLAQSRKTHGNFAGVPLTNLKQSLLGGDPNQLPLIALHDQFASAKRVPSVVLDRSNPKRIVAILNQNKLSTDTIYRVEMVPS